jgi:hypothetical protein
MPGRGFVQVPIYGVFRYAVVHQHDVERSDVAIILVIKTVITHDTDRVPMLIQHCPYALPVLARLVFVSPVGPLRRLGGMSLFRKSSVQGQLLPSAH